MYSQSVFLKLGLMMANFFSQSM